MDEQTLFEKRDIFSLKLDLDIARHLYDCTSADTFRMALYRTLHVGEHEGQRYMVATDTVCMAWIPTTLPPGTYRWLRRPSKDLQMVEAVDGQFPDWARVAFERNVKKEKVGQWQPSIGALTFCRLQSITVDYLPKLNACWTIWSTGEDDPDKNLWKPLVFTPDIERYGSYILMPRIPEMTEEKA